MVSADLGKVDMLGEVQKKLSDNPVYSWRDPVNILVTEAIDNCKAIANINPAFPMS